jgi:hypothetical protein
VAMCGITQHIPITAIFVHTFRIYSALGLNADVNYLQKSA